MSDFLDHTDLPGTILVPPCRVPCNMQVVGIVDLACERAEAGIGRGDIPVNELTAIAQLCDGRGRGAQKKYAAAFQRGNERRKRGY